MLIYTRKPKKGKKKEKRKKGKRKAKIHCLLAANRCRNIEVFFKLRQYSCLSSLLEASLEPLEDK